MMEAEGHGVAVVEGKEFPITDYIYKAMPFFQESEMLGEADRH